MRGNKYLDIKKCETSYKKTYDLMNNYLLNNDSLKSFSVLLNHYNNISINHDDFGDLIKPLINLNLGLDRNTFLFKNKNKFRYHNYRHIKELVILNKLCLSYPFVPSFTAPEDGNTSAVVNYNRTTSLYSDKKIPADTWVDLDIPIEYTLDHTNAGTMIYPTPIFVIKSNRYSYFNISKAGKTVIEYEDISGYDSTRAIEFFHMYFTNISTNTEKNIIINPEQSSDISPESIKLYPWMDER